MDDPDGWGEGYREVPQGCKENSFGIRGVSCQTFKDVVVEYTNTGVNEWKNLRF